MIHLNSSPAAACVSMTRVVLNCRFAFSTFGSSWSLEPPLSTNSLNSLYCLSWYAELNDSCSWRASLEAAAEKNVSLYGSMLGVSFEADVSYPFLVAKARKGESTWSREFAGGEKTASKMRRRRGAKEGAGMASDELCS